ncbi:putative damage-inducible protein DinB [Friedmanniella endophytica]|uniref:Putative damage-inducible protein DinB n=1 Tax=Microlunatus kandeliicorticis TaxID=1759536 RepID=A0A7W3ITT5_9ACTN|nr:DinB family protein [Microlunatus kandeliicorticis]MBA8795128.1 putative damage-inducible protein DinB [Microlunatus kandeliicorticis]
MSSTEEVPERWHRGTVHDDMWVDPDEDPRETGQVPEGEREVLLSYLDAYRHTLRMKCAGLDAEQLARRSVPPSTMSLLGLVRHLAEVERSWTRRYVLGQDVPPLHGTPEDRDADFDGAVGDPEVVGRAFADWEAEMAVTDTMIASTADLGTRAVRGQPVPPELRDILVHLIEEYARHCGHADLLRERIDGRVGQ